MSHLFGVCWFGRGSSCFGVGGWVDLAGWAVKMRAVTWGEVAGRNDTLTQHVPGGSPRIQPELNRVSVNLRFELPCPSRNKPFMIQQDKHHFYNTVYYVTTVSWVLNANVCIPLACRSFRFECLSCSKTWFDQIKALFSRFRCVKTWTLKCDMENESFFWFCLES